MQKRRWKAAALFTRRIVHERAIKRGFAAQMDEVERGYLGPGITKSPFVSRTRKERSIVERKSIKLYFHGSLKLSRFSRLRRARLKSE